MPRSKIRNRKRKPAESPSRSRIRNRTRNPRKQRALRLALKTLMITAGIALIGYTVFTKGHSEYHQYLLRQAYREWETVYEKPVLAEPGNTIVTITEELPMRIVIPKIKVDLMVLYGDVFDRALQNRGPVFYQMSDLPSTEGGNVAISGHRGAIWGFFTDLDRLDPGDEIFLDTGGYRFVYQVEWLEIVEPGDWSAIESTGYPALTLQTCDPKNRRATHRLIVRAALEKVVLAPD